MSQLLGREVVKYKKLPPWPEVLPDPTTRLVTTAPSAQMHTGPSSDNSGQSLSISQVETEDELSTEEDDDEDEEENEEEEEEEEGEESSESGEVCCFREHFHLVS